MYVWQVVSVFELGDPYVLWCLHSPIILGVRKTKKLNCQEVNQPNVERSIHYAECLFYFKVGNVFMQISSSKCKNGLDLFRFWEPFQLYFES